MIPFIDFGGTGTLLHFAHANGYPPRGYSPLLEALTPHYHVTAMLARSLWQGTEPNLQNWHPFVDDLVQAFDEQNYRGVIGVGHSLGGVVTLAAALKRPEFFRAVILLDPVLFRRRLLYGWRLFKTVRLGHQVHPLIPTAKRRRKVFASADEMFSRYRRAPVFKRLDDTSLRAYVDSMCSPRADGQVELAYSPEWEVNVYESGPLDLWNDLPTLQMPLLIIRGAESDTLTKGALQKVKRCLPNAVLHDVPNTGHLVPMEKPLEVAALILKFLNGI
jgi:pimeloyl-ACP methyl ester carboxylesterase